MASMRGGATLSIDSHGMDARFGLCREHALAGGNAPQVESTLKPSNCNCFTRTVNASCSVHRSQ